MKTAAFLELNSSYSHSMLSNLLLQARALVWRPQWRWTTVAGTGKTPSAELCEALAQYVGVGAVPGSSFFKEPENRYIRLHFAKQDETLNAALERLSDIRKKLPKE